MEAITPNKIANWKDQMRRFTNVMVTANDFASILEIIEGRSHAGCFCPHCNPQQEGHCGGPISAARRVDAVRIMALEEAACVADHNDNYGSCGGIKQEIAGKIRALKTAPFHKEGLLCKDCPADGEDGARCYQCPRRASDPDCPVCHKRFSQVQPKCDVGGCGLGLDA